MQPLKDKLDLIIVYPSNAKTFAVLVLALVFVAAGVGPLALHDAIKFPGHLTVRRRFRGRGGWFP